MKLFTYLILYLAFNRRTEKVRIKRKANFRCSKMNYNDQNN